MASPFSSIPIFFRDRGGRATYWDKASRACSEKAGIRTEASTLNPECLQLIKPVAIQALMSCCFRKNLMITRRKYSDIRWISPRGIWTNLPLSSNRPSNTRQRKCGFHRKNSPLLWYARTIPVQTGFLAALL